jgi:Flp pilus assembly secretin CpaC
VIFLFAVITLIASDAAAARHVIAVGSFQEINVRNVSDISVENESLVNVVPRGGDRLLIVAKQLGETKITICTRSVRCEGPGRCTEFFVRLVPATSEVSHQMELKLGETKTLTFSKQELIQTEGIETGGMEVIRVVSKDMRTIVFEGLRVGQADVNLTDSNHLVRTLRVSVVP